jgi:hypothetical protein
MRCGRLVTPSSMAGNSFVFFFVPHTFSLPLLLLLPHPIHPTYPPSASLSLPRSRSSAHPPTWAIPTRLPIFASLVQTSKFAHSNSRKSCHHPLLPTGSPIYAHLCNAAPLLLPFRIPTFVSLSCLFFFLVVRFLLSTATHSILCHTILFFLIQTFFAAFLEVIFI